MLLRSSLAPLSIRIFRNIWIAYFFANNGICALVVIAGILLVGQNASPVEVAVLNTASTLPVVFFTLLSGVLSDTYNRKTVMLVGMGVQLLAITVVGCWSFFHTLDFAALFLLLLVTGVGTSLIMPAWQSIVGTIVHNEHIASALVLNNISFNVARAIGPAAAGALTLVIGFPPFFLLVAVCIAILITVVQLNLPTRPRNASSDKRLEIGRNLIAGLRYASHSPTIRLVLLEAFVFGLAASSIWALLPVLTEGGRASDYSLFYGAVGLGSLLGVGLIHGARKRWGINTSARLFSVLFCLALVSISLFRSFWPVFLALLVVGVSWIAVLSSFNYVIQLASPGWIRARSLALYQTTLYLGMSLGSFLWGNVAANYGGFVALAAAAVFLLTICALFLFVLPSSDKPAWSFAHRRTPGSLPALDTLPYVVIFTVKSAASLDAAQIGQLRDANDHYLSLGANRCRMLLDAEHPDTAYNIVYFSSRERYRQACQDASSGLADPVLIGSIPAIESVTVKTAVDLGRWSPPVIAI
ncbi:MFS transporter [Verticiella sediminum]|nr:MFS transporter [Verticiella sediminum]